METEKRPSPKFSGNEEYDRIRMDGREGEGHVKRSYGCMFCKQGFTNAQALGGHMNIHRKDRLKGKGYQRHHHQVPETSSDDKKLEARDSRINTRMSGGERLRLMGPYAIRSHVHQGMADQNKFVRIPGTSAASPRQKHSFTERNFWVRNSHSPWGTDHGYLDDSLSLHIGSSLSSDHKEPDIEVDLELRLGRDPQFETR